MNKQSYIPRVKSVPQSQSPKKQSTRAFLKPEGLILSVETTFTSFNQRIPKLSINKTEIVAHTNLGKKYVIVTLGDKRSQIFGDHLW